MDLIASDDYLLIYSRSIVGLDGIESYIVIDSGSVRPEKSPEQYGDQEYENHRRNPTLRRK